MSVAATDIRCDCGRLLARRTAAGIELKCRRCNRQIELCLDELDGDEREVVLKPGPTGGRSR